MALRAISAFPGEIVHVPLLGVFMRPVRLAAAAASVALVGAAVGLAPANAASDGVGTALSSTKVLQAALGKDGSVLNLSLIGDESRSTTDAAVAAPEAFTRLAPAALSVPAVPQLANVALPVVEARSPGGKPSVEVPGVTLPTPALVASGSIDPAKLTATLTDGTAASSLTAGVSNLGLLGGLVAAQGLSSTLGTHSASADSVSTRSVRVGAVTVLDLSALLSGLGIKLSDLPVSTVTALLDQLQVPVVGLSAGQTLNSAVSQLQGAIDSVQATVNTTTGTVTGTVDSTVNGVLGSVGVTAPTAGSTVAQVGAVVDQLQAQINNLLANGVAALEAAPLLKLDGVEVGVSTKATDSVDTSAADIVGKVGAVQIGGIKLAGVDLAATASQLNALMSSVNSQVGNVLKTVSPDLAGIVNVSVLDQAKSVTSTGGYTRSRAGITAVTATVTPPANLAAIVATVTGAANTVGSTLGSALPAISPAMTQLQSTLGLASSVLTAPATLKVAEVLSASDFAAAAAPGTPAGAPGGELPRTGGTPVLPIVAGLLALIAVGARRTATIASRS
jgi:hypothetical protein